MNHFLNSGVKISAGHLQKVTRRGVLNRTEGLGGPCLRSYYSYQVGIFYIVILMITILLFIATYRWKSFNWVGIKKNTIFIKFEHSLTFNIF